MFIPTIHINPFFLALLFAAAQFQTLIYEAKSWLAFALRQREDATSVSVTAAVLCASPGRAEAGLEALPRQAQ